MPKKLKLLTGIFTGLFIFFSTHLYSQSAVTGRILGADKQPVVGATVQVKGSKISTVTAVCPTWIMVITGDRSG